MNVIDAIRLRRSVRSFRPQPIPDEALLALTEALRSAPSACNFQPWRFIFVDDSHLRMELANAARQQMFIAEAPLVVVACVRPSEAYDRMGGYWNSCDLDVANAVNNMILAATEKGLGACWIGSFEEEAVKKLLAIPEEAKVAAIVPVGYPSREDMLRTLQEGERKPREEVISRNRY